MPASTGGASSFSKVSLETDMVFEDGFGHRIANVTGNATSGSTARLTMAVA